MNDPRIANPIILAAELYYEGGTLGETTVRDQDITEMLEAIDDPETELKGLFFEPPTREDIIRTYEILGAKYERS